MIVQYFHRVDACKYMGSKMAPLFLVFKNEDQLGDDVPILYKNGDGKFCIFSGVSLNKV